MKKKFLLFSTCLSLMFGVNSAKADSYYGGDRLDYNIFATETWTVSPYVYFGYAMLYASHENQSIYMDADGKTYDMKYHDMLKNLHNGYKFALGVTINYTWSFEISTWHVSRKTFPGGYFATNENYSNINHVSALSTLLSFDAYMRLPFTFQENKISMYITGGMNVIVSTINKDYKDPTKSVPSWVAKDLVKTAFGLNAGIALRYNLTNHLFLQTEARRLWILTSSLTNDAWLFSAGGGISF